LFEKGAIIISLGAIAPQTWRQEMFYYKAEATFTINGAEATLNGCKASERNYSHAVITVASVNSETYLDGTPNPDYGKTISMVSFHQGLDNAVKASKSKYHAMYGGKAYLDRKGNYKHEFNPTADVRIVETTLVDGKTYRNFKSTYIDHNGQVVTK
jgi:uncharacterized lipoprotein NlpE involved in copper resistance